MEPKQVEPVLNEETSGATVIEVAGKRAQLGGRQLAGRYAFLVGVAALVVIADQVAKTLVAHALAGRRPWSLLGGLVRIDYTVNTGAAFSLLSQHGSIFTVAAILVSFGILLAYRRVAASPLAVRLALALVLGGATGNLIDRVRLGYVVDFIDLGWWPVFNIADSAIVVGMVLLAGLAFLRPRTAVG